MSRALHLLSQNILGYGSSDGMCLPCSGASGRTISVHHGDHKNLPPVESLSLRRLATPALFVCKANSGNNRRNRQNGGRNDEESEMLSSRNGPLLSISGTRISGATAGPGPREKEIIELFRRVQAQLREREAAIKEEKKFEVLQGPKKENEAIDSLLKLLQKHTTEQGKRKLGNASGKDFFDQQRQNGPPNGKRIGGLFNSNNLEDSESQQPNSSSAFRPPSNSQRRSPTPQVEHQAVLYDEEEGSSIAQEVISGEMNKKSHVGTHPEPEPRAEYESELEEPEAELDLEACPELQPEAPEASFSDEDAFDVISEAESSDAEEIVHDEHEEEDLCSLKLVELRAMAKSRGMKGYSKLKKNDLVELLGGTSL